MEFKGQQDIEWLSEQLNGESPRCVVIVTAAFIDEAETLLGKGLSEGDFFHRIKKAATWSLLTENEQQDLDTLRQLRDGFAHELQYKDFDATSAAKVAAMKTWKIASASRPLDRVIKGPEEQLLLVAGTIAFRLQRRTKAAGETGPLPEPDILDFKSWPAVSSL